LVSGKMGGEELKRRKRQPSEGGEQRQKSAGTDRNEKEGQWARINLT